MSLFKDSLLLVDGELRPASGGKTYPVITPWTGEEVGRAADASVEDVEAAIAAARRAFDETDWWSDHAGRYKILSRFAELLQASRDRIAEVAKQEVGACLPTIYGPQCDGALGMLQPMLDMLANYKWERDLGVKESAFGKSRVLVQREAAGVVGAITPWNFPTQVNIAKIFPALLAGCTVILKGAPETPLSAALLGEIAADAGLPKGVFNVITGSLVAELGEKLVTDPRVDLISFTGSTGVGRRIMEKGAPTLKRLFLELGGKSALIILDDADFPTAVGGAVGSLFHSGQGCACLTRVLVPKARYQEAVQILKGAYASLQYGEADNPAQFMSPLISEKQRNRVLDYIEIGKAEGATLAFGGKAPEHLPGYFVEPTLFTDVTNDMRIAREEIFGPVLVLIPFEDDDDAVRIANDSEFGLSGAIQSGSIDRAKAVARRLRTGTLGLNGGMWMGAESPFGGYKQSGIGREMGLEGFEEYMEIKTVGIPA